MTLTTPEVKMFELPENVPMRSTSEEDDEF